jgi:short-subunit dehydrogenase involved in D-alanine esterification of teichoic acids
MELAGTRILITGGGSGIGLELARRLARDNRVVISGRDEERLRRARAETPSLLTPRMDVTSEDEARDAIAWLEDELGGLDVLVNCAGLLRGYALTDAAASTKSDEDVQVNLLGHCA